MILSQYHHRADKTVKDEVDTEGRILNASEGWLAGKDIVQSMGQMQDTRCSYSLVPELGVNDEWHMFDRVWRQMSW